MSVAPVHSAPTAKHAERKVSLEDLLPRNIVEAFLDSRAPGDGSSEGVNLAARYLDLASARLGPTEAIPECHVTARDIEDLLGAKTLSALEARHNLDGFRLEQELSHGYNQCYSFCHPKVTDI
ncbi:hypothetical protein BV25DRAFT_1914659 [Artomyces pyxidatus]|uniref:Uncharacterized protein n=1 Tax=Artomyces pyxidatus TaxID=48021 RepID=A0ACB8T5F6_9AGAM|nr:hypothetical protein BV25DRAFT_1914659 [Artomyces pyxidatus]